MLEQYDAAIVFTCDTDLLPALEAAFYHTAPNLEIACWAGAKPLWFPAFLRQQRYLPYCHFLDAEDFAAARDHGKYR
ncbi:MAG TPA: hypothetical protein VMU51_36480 [Mycobacteriales bacterium]|nr:hypothetical protein [Mycobacteriales bacterium]